MPITKSSGAGVECRVDPYARRYGKRKSMNFLACIFLLSVIMYVTLDSFVVYANRVAGTGVKSLLMLPTSRAKRADVKAMNAMLRVRGAIAEPAMKRRARRWPDMSPPLSFAHHYRRFHDDSKQKNEAKE